jgi:hypothetical protein
MLNMRVFAGLFLFGSLLSAGPIGSCTTQTFLVYEGYGSNGCTVGTDYVASNFSYVATVSAALNGFSNNVNDTNLLVTPTNGLNGPDFQFSGNFGVGGGTIAVSTYTGVLKFTLTSSNTPFAALLTNALTINGTRNGLASVADVAEVNCLGGLLGPGLACLAGGLTVNNTASLAIGGTNAQAAINLGGAHLVDVVKTINLTGAIGGSASLSSIGENFTAQGGSATPEPETYGVVAITLIGFGVCRRKLSALRN